MKRGSQWIADMIKAWLPRLNERQLIAVQRVVAHQLCIVEFDEHGDIAVFAYEPMYRNDFETRALLRKTALLVTVDVMTNVEMLHKIERAARRRRKAIRKQINRERRRT